MKLIIQIPCLNEEKTLESVISGIPKKIKGISKIETLIIDDGSTDKTIEKAKELGVNHILKNPRNLGLARTFSRGMDECLRLGADIIVNTDGDNQYPSPDIDKLVAPIIKGEADIVIGNRGGMDNPHFSYFKKNLQVFGSKAISTLVGLDIPDAVSGFRAISKSAAQELHILTNFSYTIEMLVQAGARKLRVKSIDIKTNEHTRESRLFKSVPYFIKMSVTTLFRVQTMYRPLHVFGLTGACLCIVGSIPIIRFIFDYLMGDGSGHIQSLVLAGALVMLGCLTISMGILADIIAFNRKLSERILKRLAIIEDEIKSLNHKK